VSDKTQILSCLSKAQLLQLSKSFEFKGSGVLTKKDIISKFSSKRSIKIKDILPRLKLSELKDISRELGIDVIALTKDQTISKILDHDDKKKVAPKSVSPISPKTPKPKKAPKTVMKNLKTTQNSNGSNQELEKKLWQAADQLRANSSLTAQEYSRPVLGLIFLKYADHRFTALE
jgi:hypothetical protein